MPPPDTKAPHPRDHAIVVGIEDYEDDALGALRGAKNDAKEFAKWLKDPHGGGLPEKNVDLILSESGQEGCAPAAERVARAFVRLLRNANLDEEPIGRRLYVFFAGHGAGNPTSIDEVGLLPAPFSRFSTWYLVGLDYVRDMQRLAAFDEIFLFMDCCRDELPRAVRPFPLAIDVKNDASAGKVRVFVGYATEHGSKAREREFDGEGVHGVFSYALLEALRSNQTWVDGVLTAQRLASYVEERVRHYRPEGSRQEAKFPSDARGIEILRRQAQATSTTTVRVKMPGPDMELAVFFGGDLETPLEVPVARPAPDVVELALQSGRLYVFGVPDENGGLAPAAHKRIDGAEVSFEL
jgi:uncharacterized caspase-like protein